MTTRTDHFFWEQDGSGGEHGLATFTLPLSSQSVRLRIETFREAFHLMLAIEAEIIQARHDARVGLLAELARIRP